MATFWGNDGIVKVGSNAVAEVQEWEVTEEVDPVDDTAQGDTWETHIANSGHKRWSGSMVCSWDDTDASGQEALTIGASVTLNLLAEGDTTGDDQISGTVSITSVGISVPKGDKVMRNYQFKGNGAPTHGTAT
jgi:hypothetical protein